MSKASTNTIVTWLYIGNQALALITTMAFIRFGTEKFTLSWCVGVLLVTGWGGTLLGLTSPTLASRLWSMSRDYGVSRCIQALFLASIVPFALFLFPPSAKLLAEMAGLAPNWILVFVYVGIFRGVSQLLTTFNVRFGRHGTVLAFQIFGRAAELILIIFACVFDEEIWVVVALIAYPLAQLGLFLAQFRVLEGLPANDRSGEEGWKVWLVTMSAQAFDLFMPAAWLRLGGEQVYVAYRAIVAALANSALLPRYWYVVVPPKFHEGHHDHWLRPATVLFTFGLSAIYQWGTNAVAPEIIYWTFVPLFINSLLTSEFSKVRQRCLNRGQVMPPALAVIAAHTSIAIALVALHRFGAGGGMLLLAYAGAAVSNPILNFLLRDRAK